MSAKPGARRTAVDVVLCCNVCVCSGRVLLGGGGFRAREAGRTESSDGDYGGVKLLGGFVRQEGTAAEEVVGKRHGGEEEEEEEYRANEQG